MMAEGLTKEERDILELTADVWNRFLDLPRYHNDEVSEFRRTLHDLQRFILSRVAMRVPHQEILDRLEP
jgi:hypothetical protein